MLEPWPPLAATSSPCATLRWAPGSEEAEGGFRSSSGIPTFKICQIIFLSEELSSKYISIFPDVFKYTGLEPRRREYEPAHPTRVNLPHCRSEIIIFCDWHTIVNIGKIPTDHRFPFCFQEKLLLIDESIYRSSLLLMENNRLLILEALSFKWI